MKVLASRPTIVLRRWKKLGWEVLIIYVMTSWLNEVPEIRDSTIIDEEEGAGIAAFVSASVTPGFPFVKAELVRRPADADSPFFLAYIPADAVRGIFDLTEEQAAKVYGFVPPPTKP